MAGIRTKPRAQERLTDLGLILHEDSPRESWTDAGLEVLVETAGDGITWAGRIAKLQSILGGVNTGGEIISLPMQYSTLYSQCWAVTCDVIPFAGRTDKTTTYAEPKYAALSIRFRTMDWVTSSDTEMLPLFSETLEASTEFLTVPPKDLYWDPLYTAIPVEDNEAPGIIKRLGTWTLNIPVANDLAPNSIANLLGWIGSLNEVEHYSTRYQKTFEIHTLLMGTPEIRPSMSPWGETQYAVVIPMAYNPERWDRFNRGGYGSAQTMYSKYENIFGTHVYYPQVEENWSGWVPKS